MKQNTDQHTPGPWIASAYKEDDGTLHTVWTEEPADGLGVLVARTCFAPASEANARLIAASPDLLGVTKSASVDCSNVAECLRKIGGTECEELAAILDGVVERSEAAIAKAQPEQKEGT